GVNYKDAMAVTATGKILKNFPLTPGIDVAGEIVESTSSQFKKGDKVLINGSGLGENIDGGFSEYVRAPDSIVVPLPEGLSTREAMILGTAGFTAALCVKRMEVNGQKPEMGPILVTGASGGVGSIAVQILARRGYEVVAVSGKSTAVDLLKSYGAQQVLSPSNLNLGQRPLESARWAGAIDNVGGELLAGIIRHIQLWGNVASVGLADSAQLHTTVMPFILRGVSLLGASSANCPIHLKQEIWQDLGANWKPLHLDNMINSELHLEDIREYSEQLLARQKMGRALVKL
ncbi:MAG: YhdH/YhfP family quinone oxidoreductase, partial [Bdellovibrionales bacterium]|nr:YhdH/YhfP family quinone oxidoreductase [Bdellovibrionales bacterium]